MKKQRPKQEDSNEDLVKLISLIKMIPIDTFKDPEKLDAALDALAVQEQDKKKMFQSLERYMSKIIQGKKIADDQVFYSYQEALDHFFTHIYKSYIKTAPKSMKTKLYRAKSEYEGKTKNLSDAKIHQILHLAGYDIVYIDDENIRISYPS